ncbi:Flagellar brake protein YcgR [compost metagenome]
MRISRHGDAMNWNQAVEQEWMAPKSTCRLIIVGETKDGQPFCYEESFCIQKTSPIEFTVFLEFPSIHPLEKLDHVSFIECSFRDRGVLYYAFIDLIQLEIKKTSVHLTLTAPDKMNIHQRRRFDRMPLTSRTPITAKILGTREQNIQQGIAFSGQLLDISRGGLSFIAPYRLFHPLFLELSFLLPNYPEKFVILGEIVRIANFSYDSYRISVQFSEMPAAISQRIEQFCSTIST